MSRFAALALALAVAGCAFDTSVEGELAGIAGDAASVDAAVVSDALVTVPDASPPAACALLGTIGEPITHLGQINALETGRYYMFLGLSLFEGEVNVDENGASWLMVLNYLHRGDNNAGLTVRDDGLPLVSLATLGGDESESEYWAHASPSLLSAFGAEELRFFAETTEHDRRIHFRSAHSGCLDYFQTGSGSCNGLGESFTPYSNHSSLLPANQNAGFQNRGNFAMTNFPFYRSGQNHWGIRGGGARWEVDDFGTPDSDTLHRVWVRSPSVCGDGVVEGTEQCDDGNLVAGDGCDCCTSG